jgi:glucose-6-phosphate isomerase, archaeal
MPDVRPLRVTLDFATGGLTPFAGSFDRRLSDMADSFEDTDAVKAVLGSGADPVIYTGFDAAVPARPDHLLFRTTIINAGVIGSEFFMTKGHHHVRDSAEIYLGMSGTGTMVMQARDGDFATEPLLPGSAVYIPPGWAHRTVNTGDGPLSFLAVYYGDAGHDYESVRRSGFARRVYRGQGGPECR